MTVRGLRQVIIVLAALAVLTAPGAAAPGVRDAKAVPVGWDGGVYCSFDATTIKRFTALSGATFADVRVKYRFAAGAGHSSAALAAGWPAGLAADEAGEVRVRYLFRLNGDRPGQEPLKVELEKEYVTAAGEALYHRAFSAPGYLTRWQRLNGLEEKVLLRLLTQKAFHAEAALDPALADSAPIVEAGEGFLGYPWGTRPGAFADAVHVADIDDDVAVYHAAMDVWPVLGKTRSYTGVWLVFSKRDGLVEARIMVDGGQVNAVEKQLFAVAGPPLVLEKRLDGTAPGELALQWLWHTGRTTRVALLEGISGAAVVVGKRGFVPAERAAALEKRLAAALWAGAEERLKNGDIAAASAFYQDLQNSFWRHYYDFLPAAQQRLAALSGREEGGIVLGGEAGTVFRGLRNVFPVSFGQRWVRMDFGPVFRDELADKRPADNSFALPAAALCRVKVLPATASFAVVEQIYLDEAGRIIDDWRPWTAQGAGWPAGMVKERCESFLNGRLAAGLADTAWSPAAGDGFAGIPWGAAPESVSGIIPVGGADLGVAAVMLTDAGSRLWGGDVKPTGPGLLVFDKQQGFVGVSYRFGPSYYRQVYERLTAALGSPHTERAATVTWLAGENSVYVLDFADGGETAVVTVADRKFWYSRSVLFEYL